MSLKHDAITDTAITRYICPVSWAVTMSVSWLHHCFISAETVNSEDVADVLYACKLRLGQGCFCVIRRVCWKRSRTLQPVHTLHGNRTLFCCVPDTNQHLLPSCKCAGGHATSASGTVYISTLFPVTATFAPLPRLHVCMMTVLSCTHGPNSLVPSPQKGATAFVYSKQSTKQNRTELAHIIS